MKKQNTQSTDIVFGSIFLAFGAAAYYLSYGIRDVSGTGVISAATVPRLCAIVLMALGIILAAAALLKKSKISAAFGREASEQKNIRAVLPAFYILADFILYAALIRPIGFLLVTPPFAFSLMFLLAPAGSRKPFQFLAIAVIATVIIYVLFVYGFRVMLPAGIIKI
jgi:hypothetical protein